MRNSYKPYIGRRVVVQAGEDSIEGQLASVAGGVLVLRDASLLGSRPTPMDGEVLVTLPVRWVQVA